MAGHNTQRKQEIHVKICMENFMEKKHFIEHSIDTGPLDSTGKLAAAQKSLDFMGPHHLGISKMCLEFLKLFLKIARTYLQTFQSVL
jgi:hypothetical protein